MENFELSNASSQKNFQCPVCKKHFSRKFTLDMHLLIHKGLKPHSCSFCGRCFRQKGTLMRHKALHSTTAMFQCHLCNKAYRQKNVYLHHLKYTHKISATNSLDRKKCSTQIDNSQVMTHAFPFLNSSSFLPNESEKSLQEAFLSDSVDLSLSSSERTRNITRKSSERVKHEKLVANTESYWRCDFCGIIMKYDYESCTRHVSTHKKEFPFQCFGCSSVFFQKTDLICHHSQCPGYQSYLQTKSSSIRSLEEISNALVRYDEPETSNNKAISDITFTCIPCQQDFQSEEDFECHVKTHVQSVLGDGSNPDSSPDFIESKYTPLTGIHSDYPSSSTMENSVKVCDSYECGNPYELINTVVAGANSVLNFMSNINNEESSNNESRKTKALLPRFHRNKVIYKDIKINEDFSRESIVSQINLNVTDSQEDSLNGDHVSETRSRKDKKQLPRSGPRFKTNNGKPPEGKYDSLKKSVSGLCGSSNDNKRLECDLSRAKIKLRTINHIARQKTKPLKSSPRNEKQKIYACKICKMKFKTRIRRELHLQKHMEVPSLKCNLCNKPFLSKFKLSQHLRHYHAKKYTCPHAYCLKTFTYKIVLDLHRKSCVKGTSLNFRQLFHPSMAYAPVIDMNRLSAENEECILGIIPLNDNKYGAEESNYQEKPRFGIPVLSLSSTKNGCSRLPIVGEVSLAN